MSPNPTQSFQPASASDPRQSGDEGEFDLARVTTTCRATHPGRIFAIGTLPARKSPAKSSNPVPALSYRSGMNTIRKTSSRSTAGSRVRGHERLRTIAAIGLCCVTLGCAGTVTKPASTTQVAYHTVDSQSTERYALRKDENATIPVPTQAAPPEYPPAMIAEHLAHVAVRAKVIVDTEGKVSEVRIERSKIDVAYPAAFDDAVRAAASRWRYAPLRIQEWEDVLDGQGNVADSRLVRDETKPFSLDYAFSFDLRDGKPVVATNPAGAR